MMKKYTYNHFNREMAALDGGGGWVGGALTKLCYSREVAYQPGYIQLKNFKNKSRKCTSVTVSHVSPKTNDV